MGNVMDCGGEPGDSWKVKFGYCQNCACDRSQNFAGHCIFCEAPLSNVLSGYAEPMDPFHKLKPYDWKEHYAIRHTMTCSTIDSVHRIISGAPITPRELRCAGVFCFIWFGLDVFWFVSTLNHWFGL